jgi:hypothetical protein
MSDKADVWQGTLALMVLKTLETLGPQHGYVRHVGLGTPPRAELFLNSMQSLLPWPWLVLTVRADGDPALLAAPVKA